MERLNLFRKLALVFTILKELLTICLLVVFTSLFLSFFKLSDFEGSYFPYIVLGFILLVLIIILYSTFKKQLPLTIQHIFPNNSISDIAFSSYSITLVFIVLYAAWIYANRVFTPSTLDENTFDFFLGWISSFGLIIVIILIQSLINMPINRFKKAYFELIGQWLIKQVDKNVVQNESFKWKSNSNVVKSESNETKPNRVGFQLLDLELLYPDKSKSFYTLEIEQSLTFFSKQELPFDCAKVHLKTKEVKQSSGKTEISISSLFNGTLLKKPVQRNSSTFLAENTSFYVKNIHEEKLIKTLDFDGYSVDFSGDVENQNLNTIGNFVTKMRNDWKTDIRLLISNNFMYLSIGDTNIFQDYALSATLFDNSHIRKPLETIQGFYQLEV